jgi:dihydroorotase
MPLMEPGDVLAHPFTRHPGGFVSAETGEVHPVVWAALERGVTVDVGHGSHFSFEMARRTITAGIRPHTLGADMHGYNVRPPSTGSDQAREENPFFGVAPFNLTHAMTELMALGLTLPDIVATVTSNPARMVKMEDKLGALAVGREADISVLNLMRGRFTLSDNSGEKVIADQMLTPAFALRAGKQVIADSPLIPPAALLAA